MDIARLNPWNWFKKEDEQEKILPVKQTAGTERHSPLSPLAGLHSEIDRIFDRAFHGFGAEFPLWSAGFSRGESLFKPKVDVGGSDKEYTISVELPGIDEKDISVELNGDALVIKGEKKQEEKTEEKGFYRVERSYGSFQRVLNVPDDANVDGIKATYANGVLRLVLPRKEQSEPQTRKIAIG